MIWKVDEERIKSVHPSVAEVRIIKILQKLSVEYYREVCFQGCVSKKGYYLKFDFYFPSKNILIEYDGSHHKEKSVKENDEIKNKFVIDKGLILIRLNKKDWKFLEKRITQILTKYNLLYDTSVNYKNIPISPRPKKKVIKNKKKKKLTRQQKALRKIPVTIDDYNRLYGKK